MSIQWNAIDTAQYTTIRRIVVEMGSGTGGMISWRGVRVYVGSGGTSRLTDRFGILTVDRDGDLLANGIGLYRRDHAVLARSIQLSDFWPREGCKNLNSRDHQL